MLKVTNISKTFFKGTSNEKKALNGLSLTLNDGDFCTVIGGNGAGFSMPSPVRIFPMQGRSRSMARTSPASANTRERSISAAFSRIR